MNEIIVKDLTLCSWKNWPANMHNGQVFTRQLDDLNDSISGIYIDTYPTYLHISIFNLGPLKEIEAFFMSINLLGRRNANKKTMPNLIKEAQNDIDNALMKIAKMRAFI